VQELAQLGWVACVLALVAREGGSPRIPARAPETLSIHGCLLPLCALDRAELTDSVVDAGWQVCEAEKLRAAEAVAVLVSHREKWRMRPGILTP